MNLKQLFLAAFCILFTFSVYGQSDNSGQQYQKFYLSLNAGMNFNLGSSSTELSNELIVPPAKRGFSPGFDGAWFFSKNYGVGIKYAFYTSKYNKESYLEYTEHSYDYPVYEYKSLAFKEKSHMFGPAIYGRWPLGETKWMIMANAGVVMFYNELTGIEKIITYIIDSPDLIVDQSQLPEDRKMGGAYKGIAAGFTLSGAIRYQLLPFAGITVQTSGIYAPFSRMSNPNLKTGPHGEDFSRRIGRVGLSAAIDFSF